MHLPTVQTWMPFHLYIKPTKVSKADILHSWKTNHKARLMFRGPFPSGYFQWNHVGKASTAGLKGTEGEAFSVKG